MDRRKAEGACFYCSESGHMANECPKKEVNTNHICLSEESRDSSEGEYELDTDSTEELDGSGSVRTYKTTVSTPKNRPFQALEFTININGKPARALLDTGTIGGTLISNKFVATNNIPYTASVTCLFLSNENTVGPAIDLLALVLREASKGLEVRDNS